MYVNEKLEEVIKAGTLVWIDPMISERENVIAFLEANDCVIEIDDDDDDFYLMNKRVFSIGELNLETGEIEK